jgi:hypothetical protein
VDHDTLEHFKKKFIESMYALEKPTYQYFRIIFGDGYYKIINIGI